MKRIIGILLLPIFLLGDHDFDFHTLMGRHLPEWGRIQQAEDFQRLEFFRATYERNIWLYDQDSPSFRIPSVIHFIWVGPHPFPTSSIPNVQGWIDQHPKWRCKFWTDQSREAPDPRMEVVYISDFAFSKLDRCYHESDSYGEKSDVLRYEILYHEGGLYVDHDVKCFRPFDRFHHAYDFYCGVEMPHICPYNSCITTNNAVVGSTPGHAILGCVIDIVEEHWDRIGNQYSGTDGESLLYRVFQRTYDPLNRAFQQVANTCGNRDIAFPAFYFHAPAESCALFAWHYCESRWKPGFQW